MIIPPYMEFMLKNIMPEMILQLTTGVNQYRICEMVEFLNGTIDHEKGIASFTYNGVSYTVYQQEDGYWTNKLR